MSDDKKKEETPVVANQHLADKIAGKVDHNNEPIEAQEDAPAETPIVDKNEHLAKVHENDAGPTATPIAGEKHEEIDETPDEEVVDPQLKTPEEETPGE
jgi:hypothetical protein